MNDNGYTRDLLEVDYMEWLEQELTNRYGELFEDMEE